MQGKIKPDDANTEKQSLDLLFLSSPITHDAIGLGTKS
jgi:hypothetical protein